MIDLRDRIRYRARVLLWFLSLGLAGLDPLEVYLEPEAEGETHLAPVPCPRCGRADGTCSTKIWRKPCPSCSAVGRHSPCLACGEVF